MAKQLVLGGSGFIGSHLGAALVRAGEPVVCVGRRFHGPYAGVEQREVDLYACSVEQLKHVIGDAETVYHLAWSTFPATAETDLQGDLAANVGFMARLLEALRGSDRRLVFCSSGGTVYGPSDAELIAEQHPLRPITAYGAGKVASEVYAGLYRRAYSVDVRIARLANPYGLGQDPARLQGALTRFAAQALEDSDIEIWGDGEVVRDYIHIDDAVAALRRLGDAPRNALGDDAIFNVGSGCGASLNDLIRHIETALQRRLKVKYQPGRKIDAPRNVLAIDKAAQHLGWRPTISVEDGLVRLLLGERAPIGSHRR